MLKGFLLFPQDWQEEKKQVMVTPFMLLHWIVFLIECFPTLW
jgi:hypothetical protein